jgi:hypothetical protein
MSGELQEWLALAIVTVVAGIALWRRLKRQRSSGCNDCSATSCHPHHRGTHLPTGIKTDPYRPQLTRPAD